MGNLQLVKIEDQSQIDGAKTLDDEDRSESIMIYYDGMLTTSHRAWSCNVGSSRLNYRLTNTTLLMYSWLCGHIKTY